MLRVLSVIAVLIAYLSGASHCVLAEIACQKIDSGACHSQAVDTTAAIAEAGSGQEHFHHHAEECSVEATLVAPTTPHGASRIMVTGTQVPPPAWAEILLATLATVCALPQRRICSWLERERLPFLESSWQFMTRASAPACAP